MQLWDIPSIEYLKRGRRKHATRYPNCLDTFDPYTDNEELAEEAWEQMFEESFSEIDEEDEDGKD